MQMGLNQLGSNQMNKLWTIRISAKSAQDCEQRLLSTAQKIGAVTTAAMTEWFFLS